MNTYGYADGSPLTSTDPYGLLTPAGGIFIVGTGYGAYMIWDKSHGLKKCEELCPALCSNIRACGDKDQNIALEANTASCTNSCKSNCFLEVWGGVGRKGPRGPTPPNNASGFLK